MRRNFLADLVCAIAAVVRDDAGHEGAELDVFVVTCDVDCVLPGLRRPVADVTRTVVLVLALDLGLGRPFDGKTCRRTGPMSLDHVATINL